LTGSEADDTRTKLLDCSRELSPWRERQGDWPFVLKEAFADLPINGIDPGGIDTNEHLADLWFWTWDLLQNKLFWATIRVETNRSHRVI
jgi:hypothetical protein